MSPRWGEPLTDLSNDTFRCYGLERCVLILAPSAIVYCNIIVAGSYPLGGPLTSVVGDDFGGYHLKHVVLCPGHDPVRTCTLWA